MLKFLMAKADEELYKNLAYQCDLFGQRRVDPVGIDEFIDDTKKIKFLDNEIKVISTPGHSRGSVCYLIDDNLFSGDTLFLKKSGGVIYLQALLKKLNKVSKKNYLNLMIKLKFLQVMAIIQNIGHEKSIMHILVKMRFSNHPNIFNEYTVYHHKE